MIRQKLLISLVLILILAGSSYALFQNKDLTVTGSVVNDGDQNANPSVKKKMVITKDNFASYLVKQKIIQDLPDDARILLRFYNFNSGAREWEESYLITKGKIELARSLDEGDDFCTQKEDVCGSPEGVDVTVEDIDIEIILSSDYIPKLGNFCSAIKQANKNGDLGFEYKGSKAGLLWKFKSMNEYKDCLGF